jgi:endonuclease G
MTSFEPSQRIKSDLRFWVPANLAILLLLLSLTALVAPDASADALGDCGDMIKGIGAPEYKGDPPEATVLCRKGYLLSHNTERKTPDWAVERLTPSRFKGPGNRTEQGNPFAADPDLAKGQRAELKDYRGSGFDRGHMAPAASMKFSVAATTESFYLSNMSPQIGPNMNRGIWADLEEMTRNWTCERGDLVVITGPIYGERPKTIGDDHVAIPKSFYKVAYDPTRGRAIAFVLPNKEIEKNGQAAWDVLKNYVVTIREVEDMVGIDFLTQLDTRSKRRLEGLRSVMWPVRARCSA